MEHRSCARRAARVRAACSRCQKRKIRCDGSVPICGACQKAGVACEDNPSSGIPASGSARSYITGLQRRIAWLESIIARRCPDVDLSETSLPDAGSSTEPCPHPASPSNQDTRDVDRNGLPDQRSEPSHQIGLVALTPGIDSKYIGPSSGFFFARLVLAAVRRQGQQVNMACDTEQSRLSSMLSQDVFERAALPSLPTKEQAIQLSALYFDTVHRQYPFLHRPSHMAMIGSVYASQDPKHIDLFRLKMVLAIAATDLSRRFRGISGSGYAASAMNELDKFATQDSLEGVQCLLLLLLYSLLSPSLGINAWHINYQCLAAVLDLGLQRDIRATCASSRLKQELRTRVFWVIYSFDRTLATIMGRPIGLRDEGCDLRLPLDMNDAALEQDNPVPRQANDKPTDMSYAIHLFGLAHLNSEIKYILHSVSKEPPRFTYPSIPDVNAWQQDLLIRLETWAATIPSGDAQLTHICQIRYHEMRMALLRPTPRLPRPTQASLELCLQSSIESLALYDTLYRTNGLQYTWMSIHSTFLTGLTMLYCVWALPTAVKKTKPDVFVASLKTASNVLSAIGEHWSEAKRCREVLDDLASVTVRRIFEMHSGKRSRTSTGTAHNSGEPQTSGSTEQQAGDLLPSSFLTPRSQTLTGNTVNTEAAVSNFEDWSTAFFGDMGWADQLEAASSVNVDDLMRDFDFGEYTNSSLGFDLNGM